MLSTMSCSDHSASQLHLYLQIKNTANRAQLFYSGFGRVLFQVLGAKHLKSKIFGTILTKLNLESKIGLKKGGKGRDAIMCD